jgi:hypothetical protein
MLCVIIITMENIKIKLSYWTYPEGDDFDGIEAFKTDLSKEFDAEITSQPTDAMGGGLYEFVIEIINNIDFADIAKNYLEDGVKIGIGFFWKPIFKRIKELFKKNKQYSPEIEVAKFVFNDVEIIIYPLYHNSIDEVIDETIQTLSQHYSKIISETTSVKSIHIPIFNQVDTYEVCAYRVRLNVDENITSFKKEDYFKLWGIKGENDINYIYDLKSKSIFKTRFYTQQEYDILLDEKFETEG